MSDSDVQLDEDPLTYTSGLVAWYRENALELAPGNSARLLAHKDGDRFSERLLSNLLAAGRVNPTDAAKEASAGDSLYYGALCHLAADELSGEVRLQEPLRSYVIAVLRERPPLKRARRRETNYLRDVCLTMLVREVRDRFNLPATGNSARRQSACGIVAQATGMESGAVTKVVQKFRHII